MRNIIQLTGGLFIGLAIVGFINDHLTGVVFGLGMALLIAYKDFNTDWGDK